MVDCFKETWELQERARERCAGRVRELVGRVEGLERGSWGMEGAVEEGGGGG